MEGFRANHSVVESPEKRKERLRDRIFQSMINGHVLDTFTDDLANADIPEETIQEMEETFAGLSEEDKRAVLAIPKQLRVPLFKKYGIQVEAGTLNGHDVIQDILIKANEHGFTLGFHLSLFDIRPTQDGSWYIKGTEPDHRHNDLPMAYYSMNYTNRYKDKKNKIPVCDSG